MSRKVVKGVRTTEEERFLKLQQKLQAEKDLAKKNEEMLQLYLRDTLRKEKEEDKLNLLKLNEKWRKIRIQDRESELPNCNSVFRQTFEMQLDHKNSIVQRLLHDLQEAELQEVQQQNSSLQHVEHLWAEHHKWVKILHQHLEVTPKMEMILKDHQQLVNYVQTPELQRAKQIIPDFKFQQIQSEEDLLKMMEADIQDPQDIQLQHQKIHQMVHSKKKELDQNTSRVEEERSKDQQRKIEGLMDKCLQLTQQIASEKIELIKQDTAYIKDRPIQWCKEKRVEMAHDRQVQKKQLRKLSVWSDSVIKKMENYINQGERVLRFNETCLKLEDSLGVLTSSLVSTEDRRQVWNGPAQEFWELEDLEELQQRFNIALLHSEVLKKQNLDMRQENEQLALLLNQDTKDLQRHPTLLQVTQPLTPSIAAADRRLTINQAAVRVHL